MKDMILTYKLTLEQNSKLCAVFPECEISDVSTAFTDILAVPAVAVVINLEVMTEEEIGMFTEVFAYDNDTSICIIGESCAIPEEHLGFLHCIEKHPVEMSDTIAAIQDRLRLPLELEAAKVRMNALVERIAKDIACEEDDCLLDKVMHIENACLDYERISTIFENRSHLKSKAKYPYRVNISSVIAATMIAHNLMQESELEDSNSLTGLLPDREWILALASDIKAHYDREVKKNSRYK